MNEDKTLQNILDINTLKELFNTIRELISTALEELEDKKLTKVVFDLYVIEKTRWQKNKPLSSFYKAYLVDLDNESRTKISKFVYKTFEEFSFNIDKYTLKDFFSYEPKHRTDLMILSPKEVGSFLEVKRQIVQGGRSLKRSIRSIQKANGFVFYFDFGSSGRLMIITNRRSPISLKNKKNRLWIIPRENRIEVTMDAIPVPVDSIDAIYFEFKFDSENEYIGLIVNNKGYFETLFGLDKVYEKHAKIVLKRLKAKKILEIQDTLISEILSKKSSIRKDLTNLAKTGVLKFLYLEKKSQEYELAYKEFVSRMAVYAKLRGSNLVKVESANNNELPRVSVMISDEKDIKTFIDLCKKRYTVDYSQGEPILVEVDQGTPLGPIEEKTIEEAKKSLMYWIQKYSPSSS